MAESDNPSMLFSIQRTYIINPVAIPGKHILTCNQRIDIPTIEPLSQMRPDVYPNDELTVVPCIELKCKFLDEFNFAFETNEGVTVQPVKIDSGRNIPLINPYVYPRYMLMLPRGATGVKSCKIFYKGSNIEVQHNFTFGIMPPPYNYDNALFGILSDKVVNINAYVIDMNEEVTNLEARVRALENKAGG